MLLAVLLVLLAVEALYVAGGALFLNVVLPRLVARNGTARLSARAFTVLPGLVHVRRFRLDVEDEHASWSLTIRRARLRVALSPLARKTLDVSPLRAQGVTFRLRPERGAGAAAGGGADAGASAWPPVPDLPAPRDRVTPPRDDPWTYRIGPVDAAPVEEIWVGAVRLAGAGRLTGGPFVRTPHDLRLDEARLGGLAGTLTVGGAPAAELATGELTVRLAPFDPERVRGPAALRHLSGEAKLGARVAGLEFLNFYLRRARFVALEDGPGELHATLKVRDGAFVPGTRAVFRSSRAGARILDWHARGPGDVTFEVVAPEPAGGAPGSRPETAGVAPASPPEADGTADGAPPPPAEARLRLALGAFELAREGRPPDLRGTGLVLTATARGLAIGEPFEDPGFAVEIPRAEVPDIAVLNDFVGAGGGFAFEGGRASFEARLDLPAEGEASGAARFRGESVGLRLASLHAMADLDLQARLSGGDLGERRLGLAGTTLAIRNLALARAGRSTGRQSGWWGDVVVPWGTVSLTAPARLAARLDLHLRDSGPVLAFFTPRKGLPGWIEKLVLVENVAAIAELRLDRGRVRLEPLAVQGGPVRLEARLTLDGDRSEGDLLASAGPLTLGLELAGGRLRLRRMGGDAAEWFDERGTGAAAP